MRRVLVGLGALGVERVLLMPDRQRLAERALQGVAARAEPIPAAEIVDMPITDEPEDSTRAAEAMRRAGAGCLVVLGGDGTARVVARGAGEVPIVPISTGTNNVLPAPVEGTLAGMAAAAVARGLVERGEVALRHKRLALWLDGQPASDALVDVAALAGRYVGSRAVWDVGALRQVVVTRSSPATIGISAIAGALRPVSPEEPVGLEVRLGTGAPHSVLAAVGPGLVAHLGVVGVREVHAGERVDLVAERPLVLAMDGEREITLPAAGDAWVTLHLDGPWIVDASRAMYALASRGRLAQ